MATIAPERGATSAPLLADIDRLGRTVRHLRQRIAALEAVEVCAHRLLAAPPHGDREARERLWQALGKAEGVAA